VNCVQLGGDVEQPWLMSKYDVIHKPEVHNLSLLQSFCLPVILYGLEVTGPQKSVLTVRVWIMYGLFFIWS